MRTVQVDYWIFRRGDKDDASVKFLVKEDASQEEILKEAENYLPRGAMKPKIVDAEQTSRFSKRR